MEYQCERSANPLFGVTLVDLSSAQPVEAPQAGQTHAVASNGLDEADYPPRAALLERVQNQRTPDALVAVCFLDVQAR